MIQDIAFIDVRASLPKNGKSFQSNALQIILYSPTPSISEGPFYQEGAPFRNQLSANPTLILFGRVLNIYGEIVPEAILDIWQADAVGRYDIKEFKMRCRIKVDDKGAYELKTIRPGHYPVSTKMMRCAHIHVKVIAPGYKTLTTQLYFNDNKYNKTDPLFQRGTVVSGENGQFKFNFILEKEEQNLAGDLVQTASKGSEETKLEEQFPLLKNLPNSNAPILFANLLRRFNTQKADTRPGDILLISTEHYNNGKSSNNQIPAQEEVLTSYLCSPTPSFAEGHFYKEDAPFKTQLTNNPTLFISGRVLGTFGEPVQGAILDVWQVNEIGMYDVEGYELRGKIRADDEGKYKLKTVRPGNYLISTKIVRCAVIHVKVNAPGFKSLTTQLFFNDDEYNQTDPWFHSSTVIKEDGSFEFVLEKESVSL